MLAVHVTLQWQQALGWPAASSNKPPVSSGVHAVSATPSARRARAALFQIRVQLMGGRCCPQRPWGCSSLPPYQKITGRKEPEPIPPAAFAACAVRRAVAMAVVQCLHAAGVQPQWTGPTSHPLQAQAGAFWDGGSELLPFGCWAAVDPSQQV